MNLNTKDFLITVNLALFKVDEVKSASVKKLPQKELMVLLEKRKRAPYEDCWLFPYGFVHIDESLDQAVYRELKEKTSLENIYFEQLYTWGAVERDPTARVIATSYMAIAQKDYIKNQAIDERDDLKWFSVNKRLVAVNKPSDMQMVSRYIVSLYNREDDITISYQVIEDITADGFEKRSKYTYEPCRDSRELMAYDHIKILDYALDRIKNKVMYTNIAFGLIPEYFTLTELQQVYEIMLGKELTKPNFRRWISKKVEETQETKKAGAHRPPKLYRLKKSSIIEDQELF